MLIGESVLLMPDALLIAYHSTIMLLCMRAYLCLKYLQCSSMEKNLEIPCTYLGAGLVRKGIYLARRGLQKAIFQDVLIGAAHFFKPSSEFVILNEQQSLCCFVYVTRHCQIMNIADCTRTIGKRQHTILFCMDPQAFLH